MLISAVLCAWTRSSWIPQTSALAHKQDGGWRRHQKLAVTSFHRAPSDHAWSYSFRRSPPTLRRWLIFHSLRFLSLWYFFRIFKFFFMFTHSWFFLGLPIIYLLKIPLLCMGQSDKAPTNKICRRAPLAWLGLKRLRTRSCHEWESLVSKFRS